MSNTFVLSLFQTKDMARKLEPVNLPQLKFGNFHVGKIGTQYYVYNENFHRNLKAKDFDKAKSEAIDEIKKHCTANGLPFPNFNS